jgi:(p)ppGpp synthase/HD superfamily hydrolase
MVYSQKLKNAIKFAIKTHDVYQKQTRKGKNIAYVTHPLTVGIILANAGASEDVIAAGILHDTIEDSVAEKKVTIEMLSERFGDIVANLVSSVTETDKLLSWEERKKDALQHIGNFSHDSILVKSADIISNVTELLDDFARYGDQVFDRFNAPREKFIANQLASIEALIDKWPKSPLLEDLKYLVENIKRHLA